VLLPRLSLVTVAASTLIPSSAKRRCPFLKTEEEAKEHAVILCKGGLEFKSEIEMVKQRLS
ncbi:hypothetical protein MGG_17985, partial [Pyricularia oryzae 70-15]